MSHKKVFVLGVILALGTASGPAPADASESLPVIDDAWDYQNPRASETRFRELVERAGDNVEYRAETMTQLARAVGLQRRFDEAGAILSRAASLIAPGPSRERVRLDLERGRLANSSGVGPQGAPLAGQPL